MYVRRLHDLVIHFIEQKNRYKIFSLSLSLSLSLCAYVERTNLFEDLMFHLLTDKDRITL